MQPVPRVRPEGLTTAEVAELVGVQPATIRSYLRDARVERAVGHNEAFQFPEPDASIEDGRDRWHLTTIQTWMAARPGRGARVDLQRRTAATTRP